MSYPAWYYFRARRVVKRLLDHWIVSPYQLRRASRLMEKSRWKRAAA
jgi:hypothetical protein